MLLLLPPVWLSLLANARQIPSPRMAATGPCESSGWPLLQGVLDKVPVFTVANSEEQPLQYQVGDQKLTVFYADVKVATKEYMTARDQYPDLGCDIISIGLGNAYKLAVAGEAVIVPGMAELVGAGAPEDAQALGQELPLFACMEMKLEGDAGAKVPLFMSYDDCAAAIAQESSADAPMQINAVLSLQSLVEELAELADPTSGEFALQVPSASVQHGASYVGSGVYMRKVDEEDQ